MQNSKLIKVIIALGVLIVLIGIALQFVNVSPPPMSNPPAALKEIAQRRQLSTSIQPPALEASSIDDAKAQADEQWAKYLALKLPREKIEEYLRLHNRDAASLLAAFHASGVVTNSDGDLMNSPVGDINYLKEAATNFPNDPHVQLTVAFNAFPEEHRKWLEAFKASSPDNSLANYLSARDYFDNGQPETAIKELLEASRKSQFRDYAGESYLNTEELYRFGGKSPLEAKEAAMAAMSGDTLPGLAAFTGLAMSMKELQKQYLDAGDASSAQNLAEMGQALASRLKSGENGKLIISQLVGSAIEAISLQQLDQNTPYDFLGGKTPLERTAELKQQKIAIRELTKNNDAVFSKMSEAEMLSYYDRQRLYGELEAARWLQQRYGTKAP